MLGTSRPTSVSRASSIVSLSVEYCLAETQGEIGLVTKLAYIATFETSAMIVLSRSARHFWHSSYFIVTL